MANYLTFTAQAANSSVTFSYYSGSNVQYRKNGGSWTSCPSGTTISLESVGYYVQFKGTNVKTDGANHFSMTGTIAGSGSVTSIMDGIGSDDSITLESDCCESMFYKCASLVSAPSLIAKNLSWRCYFGMFEECSNLTYVPALPAENTYQLCYFKMFDKCTSLVNAPELRCKNMSNWCCSYMFRDCSSLAYVKTSQSSFEGCGEWLPYNVGEFHCSPTLAAQIPNPGTSSTVPSTWTIVLTSETLTVSLVDEQGGSVVGHIYNKYNTTEYYSDAALTTRITTITPPTKTGYAFAGYYNGATQIVDASGNIQAVQLSADVTATATWTRTSYTLTLDPAPGSGGTLVAYNKNGTTEYYSDASLTTRITTITLPTRDRHAFAGYYNGDTLIVNAAGEFQSVTLAADTTATASWNLTYYELTFSPSPGSGGTLSAYNKYGTSEYYSDAALTTRILSITAPTRECYSFAGYSANSTEIVDASGAFQNVTLAADTTATASWTLSSYKLTFDPNYGTGGTTAVYNKLNTAEYYSDFLFANRVTTITPPTREGKTFIGYSVNGTQVVNQAGTIVSGALSGDTTAVASWLNDTIQVMLKNSADGAVVRTIYNKPNTSEYYNESTYTNRIYSVAVPTKECYAFTGYYSGSTQAIAANGDILLGVLADDVVTVADWSLVSYKLDLNATPGTGGTAAIFNKLNTTEYYSDDLVTTRITAISVPTAPDGQYFYEYLVGGLRIVNTDGNIATGIPLSANATATATYRTTAWLYTLDHDGGTGSVNTFYVRDLTKSCYADATLATRIYSVTIPTRTGYTFTGYYDGETQQIDESGAISLTATATGGKTFTARWTANTYTLSFNKSGGSGTANPKSVTTGQAIGNLPTPTKSKHDFDGWFVDNAPISAATVWTWGENKTAVAHWSVASIGVVTDYFGLANTNLVAISSESGDNTKRVCVSHVGRYEPDVTAQSGKWRNPTVTYEVIGNMTFACQLGKAFAGSSGISGYMITSVEIDTKLGEFPRIKVSGTANEGVNAINLFNVSVPLLGRARPQNLLSAVSTSSDGGEIHAAKLTATCDPVVIEEGLMPVASDVVNGRINIDVSSLAINREGEPEANASSGFTKIGASRSAVTTYYTYWQTKFTKEIN